jgi:hypothetical protein
MINCHVVNVTQFDEAETRTVGRNIVVWEMAHISHGERHTTMTETKKTGIPKRGERKIE